jgi:hypothetical protein
MHAPYSRSDSLLDCAGLTDTFAHLPFLLFPPNQIFRCQSSIIWECVHRESGQRYCVRDRRRLGPPGEGGCGSRLPCYETPRRHGYCPSVDVIDESDKVSHHGAHDWWQSSSKVVQQEGLCESTVKLIAKTLLMGVRHLHEVETCQWSGTI